MEQRNRETELKFAFLKAIKAVGTANLKQSSMFLSKAEALSEEDRQAA